jgi:hypothetical protein
MNGNQEQLSMDVHGVVKSKNDPGLCQKNVYKGRLEQRSSEEVGYIETEESNDIIRIGNESKATIILYNDFLVSAMNPREEVRVNRVPIPHPCSVVSTLLLFLIIRISMNQSLLNQRLTKTRMNS